MNFDEIFPALGFFGASDSTCLMLSVDAPLRAVRLRLSEPRPEFLNLSGIKFLAESGRPIDLHDANCFQSSFFKATSDARSLLASSGLHTASEHAPWWRVEFAQEMRISQILIYNRSDGWASRSRSLVVEIQVGNQWKEIYSGCMPKNALSILSQLVELDSRLAIGVHESFAEFRERALSLIASELKAGRLPIEKLPLRSVLPMVRLWSGEPINGSEYTILAAAAIAQARRGDDLFIKAYSLALKSRSSIERLKQNVDEITNAEHSDPYIVTRHGLQRSRLLTRRDAYVSGLSRVLKDLESLGKSPMICYGTLLGAVREKGFIPHDDDVDVLYRTQASSNEAAAAELPKLAVELRNRGYRVELLTPHSLNMHVWCEEEGVLIDIFPTWETEGTCYLHMERMKIRGIDSNILFPRSSLQLYGEVFPAPANVEGFLLERYGPGWTSPDPFYDWPWQLAL